VYEVVISDFPSVWGDIIPFYHRLDTTDRATIDSVVRYNEYNSDLFFYESKDTFIDLGCHIGSWSVLMAVFNPMFKVYAYEALPENIKMIKKNIELNNLTNVFPFQNIVSDCSEGTERIYYTDDSTKFGASHKFVGNTLGGTGETLDVKKICINDVFLNNNIKHCKVIKTDCEGGEVHTFSTVTPETLQKIDYIIGEFHPRNNIGKDGFFRFFEPYFKDVSRLVQKKPKLPLDLQRFLFRNKKARVLPNEDSVL